MKHELHPNQAALSLAFAKKLPAFDLSWPDDWKAMWFGWVEQIVAMARPPADHSADDRPEGVRS